MSQDSILGLDDMKLWAGMAAGLGSDRHLGASSLALLYQDFIQK